MSAIEHAGFSIQMVDIDDLKISWFNSEASVLSAIKKGLDAIIAQEQVEILSIARHENFPEPSDNANVDFTYLVLTRRP
ncbi:hypothetical protein KKC63_00225 [Patescibacteria group bacterium]|nr:hypothetical protein [Patescibacteria group bacterium]MBU4023488.1 hypothetical protein [Patescibacteria group bacterium]MBU4078406.1 hypothetical protein [Patescibacteria group bacterium]